MRNLLSKLLTSIVMAFAIALPALAATPVAGHHGQGSGFLSMLPMLIIFAGLFYFLLVRPQQKRAKQQRELMGALHSGDEVVTTAGIVGRISKMQDNYATIEISKGVEITLQKQAISATLPKGTLDSIA